MDRSLDEKLVNEFPLLYADRHVEPSKTCMYWGFSCGDGWYELIHELSEELESLIREWIEQNPNGKCVCGCGKIAHPLDGECITEHHSPFLLNDGWGYTIPELWKDLTVRYPKNKSYAIKNWWRNFRRAWKYKIFRPIDQYILRPLFKWGLLVKTTPCSCEKYCLDYPRAVQVKEKFGTLRFYMSKHIPGMEEALERAYQKSAETCEGCGKPGTLGRRTSYWISTECDECRSKDRV